VWTAIRLTAGLAAIAIGLIVAGIGGQSHPEPPKGTSSGPGFALIELFTSEGCSSCPPADAALDSLADELRQGKRPVFALAFHVDYWDHLGWTDPFARPEFTARQRGYVTQMGLPSMYTPQAVVNGLRVFAGGNKARLRAEAFAALDRPATVTVKATAHDVPAGWRVDYEVLGAPPGVRVHGALVQGGRLSEVERGENAGRSLPHGNVVRAFATGAPPSGSLRLRAKGFTPDRAVVYVQDSTTLAVVAAVEAVAR